MLHVYERDGDAIYRQSFAIIRREATLSRFSAVEELAVVRMIHAAGLVGLEQHVAFTPGMAQTTRQALRDGAPILCLRVAGVDSLLTVPALAQQLDTARSAAALELWRPHLAGAVVAIGNAPTALFHLLNMLQDPDCPRPAAIIGCPVGFVGAAESKTALMASNAAPALVVHGRLGGSAITVAAINALASEREI